MRILVLGGYGLIGFPVVQRLLAAGHRVTGLGRSVAAARRSCPEASWLEHDIAQLVRASDWLPILSGFDAVLNCSGALQDSPRDNLQALQADAMKALFEACRMAGVTRVVQVSAVGVSPGSNTAFFRTKAEADAALLRSDLSWIILRPGLVLAPAAYGGTALLRGLASFPVFVPIIGGSQAIQTVSIDDVADTVRDALGGRLPANRIYDLVEERAHTLRQVVSAYREWLGLPPARILSIPPWIGSLAACVGDGLAHLGWRSPLRTTALLQLDHGVVGDPKPWIAACGRTPQDLKTTLRSRPATIQERWFARLWLLKSLVSAILALFWIMSGVVGLAKLDAAVAILTQHGMSFVVAEASIVGGSVLDILLGVLLLIRRFHRVAALGMIATSLMYLALATIVTPDLWLDPLGPLVKSIPAAVLALVALAIADER
ncbi:SDR family oxidoreductase [Microvirga puerhi]|uniref:SDR family oxidoreductase n=1 Tax=Microvirga puerhi TaxID=2876078 RepID=A0ABS7VQY2_9HYPH|nr:SDR family oxidoreductase [Microvirga puerhi]MBZ6077939.1 SDR family oxidoreductase [Microvirga puerhi]